MGLLVYRAARASKFSTSCRVEIKTFPSGVVAMLKNTVTL